MNLIGNQIITNNLNKEQLQNLTQNIKKGYVGINPNFAFHFNKIEIISD